MKEAVVSHSGVYFTKQCDRCDETKYELVQTQKYIISIGPLQTFGKGPRQLKSACIGCGSISSLTQSQRNKAEKLKYGPKTKDTETVLSSRGDTSKKLPPLSTDRRKAIRKDNRKEGLLSMLIGTIIGIIILPLPFTPWSTYLGLGIIIYSIIGGLYAIFEDPERKYRDMEVNKSKPKLKL